MAMLAADAQPNLVAMGIVSAPEYLERRAACRGSWLRYPNVGAGKAITVSFVVRSLGVPAQIDQLLRLEQAAHSDILRVNVPWNETRLRGPVLSVAAWLAYATRHLASARFIAKLDDDAYMHTPELEKLLRESLRVAPTPERIYFGPMSWFHWYPTIFERSGFGWSYTMAWSLGSHCRNVTTAEERCKHQGCGKCVGPFPFASGFLAVLSTPLAAELLAMDSTNAVRDDDLSRLRQVRRLPTRTGGVQVKVMEDIWLGSLLFRSDAARGPITYVALSEKDDKTLVSDGWGLKVSKLAVIVHVKNHQKGKQLERFLAVDDFLKGKRCEARLAVSCGGGCRSFLTDGENDNLEKMSTSGFNIRGERVPSFREVWLPRIENASFCTGVQNGSVMCRVGVATPRTRPCARRPIRPVDLLTKEHASLFHDVATRAQELLSQTQRMTAAAQGVLSLREAELRKQNARFRVEEAQGLQRDRAGQK